MTLLQQVLDVLERGEVLCEVTAANMLREAIAQGAVVVPAEPTYEMIAAAYRGREQAINSLARHNADHAAYRAMLEACK